MEILYCKQRSPEWFAARDLKLTASNATAIGNVSKGLETYCEEIVQEHHMLNKEGFVSWEMQQGIINEPISRMEYVLETGYEVEEVGFVIHNDYVGCSPDGLVNKKGNLEIKWYNDKKFGQYFKKRDIPSDYMWQMQMQMLICESEWCDYVVYNPNYKISTIIQRVYPDKSKQKKLLEGFRVGEQLIKKELREWDRIVSQL